MTTIGWHPVDLGPGVVAGFTDRFGGVSPQPWAELNLGPNVADDPARVAANRALLSELIDLPIAFATQVHGNQVLGVGVMGWDRREPPVIEAGEGDAMVTTANLALGVLVADCVPVILADAGQGVAAVAHAGRRGIELRVIDRAVRAMRASGASNLRAAIGPAICGRCYEVPAAMQTEVAAITPEAASTTRWGSPGLDLPAAAAAQLRAAGVDVVAHLAQCTMADERWYSHRRASAARAGVSTGSTARATGRFAGIVGLAK